MKKTTWISKLLFLLMFQSALAQESTSKIQLPDYKTATACQQKPTFMDGPRSEFVEGFDKLPDIGLLVARDAEYYIEGLSTSGQTVQLHAQQSFLKNDSPSKIICGQDSQSELDRYSVYAPTLIDTTRAKKTGDSLWLFQSAFKNNKFAFTATKSPIFIPDNSIEKVTSQSGAQYKLYQIDHNEFELVVTQKINNLNQYLSIRYDVVQSLGK